MPRMLAILLMTGLAGACELAPNPAEPSWADALLLEAPPSEAPAAFDTQPLSSALRAEVAASAVAVQRLGRSVRLQGLQLLAPTVDTADFVVEARERARPPERN